MGTQVAVSKGNKIARPSVIPRSGDLWAQIPELSAWVHSRDDGARNNVPEKLTPAYLDDAEAIVNVFARPATGQEIRVLVARLLLHYPDKGLSADQAKLVGEDFAMILQEHDFTIAETHRACFRWLSSDERFAPTPGALISKVRNRTSRSLCYSTEEHALEVIHRARKLISEREKWANMRAVSP